VETQIKQKLAIGGAVQVEFSLRLPILYACLGRLVSRIASADCFSRSAWFQPLNLKCDILVSKFAFTFNLHCCTSAPLRPSGTWWRTCLGWVRLYKFDSSSHSLRA
jgi:hypothetical protein